MRCYANERKCNGFPTALGDGNKNEKAYIYNKRCVCDEQFKNERPLYIGCVGFRAFVEKRNMRGRTRRGGEEIALG